MTRFICNGEGIPIDDSKCVHRTDGEVYEPKIHFIRGAEHWVETGAIIDPMTVDGVENYDYERGIIILKPPTTSRQPQKIEGVLGKGDDKDGKRD